MYCRSQEPAHSLPPSPPTVRASDPSQSKSSAVGLFDTGADGAPARPPACQRASCPCGPSLHAAYPTRQPSCIPCMRARMLACVLERGPSHNPMVLVCVCARLCVYMHVLAGGAAVSSVHTHSPLHLTSQHGAYGACNHACTAHTMRPPCMHANARRPPAATPSTTQIRPA